MISKPNSESSKLLWEKIESERSSKRKRKLLGDAKEKLTEGDQNDEMSLGAHNLISTD